MKEVDKLNKILWVVNKARELEASYEMLVKEAAEVGLQPISMFHSQKLKINLQPILTDLKQAPQENDPFKRIYTPSSGSSHFDKDKNYKKAMEARNRDYINE